MGFDQISLEGSKKLHLGSSAAERAPSVQTCLNFKLCLCSEMSLQDLIPSSFLRIYVNVYIHVMSKQPVHNEHYIGNFSVALLA